MSAGPAPLRVLTTTDTLDLLIGEIWDLDPIAVEERDGELITSFATDEQTARAIAHLRLFTTVEQLEVDEMQWRGVRQQHTHPVTIGGLTIRPPWVDGSTADIVIDSTDSFGHGGHITTSQIIAALQSDPRRSLGTVLDVGTGSGILAIVAAKIGATAVIAIDTDLVAVAAARANAQSNGVDRVVEVSNEPLATLAGAHDLVIANLPSPTVVELAPALSSRVAVGGCLMTAGYLRERADAVARGVGATMELVETRTAPDGWTCQIFVNRR